MTDREEAIFLTPWGKAARLLQAKQKNIALVSSASEILSQIPELCKPRIDSKVLLFQQIFQQLHDLGVKAKTGDFEVCFVHEVPETDLTNAILEKVD